MAGARIDGKAIAAELRQQVAADVKTLKDAHGIQPGLAVVLVGEDPASQVYVNSKIKQTEEAGMWSLHYHLPATASQQEVEDLIISLNGDDAVDGIMLQLPLPYGLD